MNEYVYASATRGKSRQMETSRGSRGGIGGSALAGVFAPNTSLSSLCRVRICVYGSLIAFKEGMSQNSAKSSIGAHSIFQNGSLLAFQRRNVMSQHAAKTIRDCDGMGREGMGRDGTGYGLATRAQSITVLMEVM